ncbi:hypothetical protein E2C01_027221 [Portunus trituberculatus]|uniref:Uncharacterized protein n=1 Tax=Portunus trituberculatus TaxID=210409 RepID=A0A5B7EKA0_PORTR|nr:hypothetical protein [Portunus trituberculatus]
MTLITNRKDKQKLSNNAKLTTSVSSSSFFFFFSFFTSLALRSEERSATLLSLCSAAKRTMPDLSVSTSTPRSLLAARRVGNFWISSASSGVLLVVVVVVSPASLSGDDGGVSLSRYLLVSQHSKEVDNGSLTMAGHHTPITLQATHTVASGTQHTSHLHHLHYALLELCSVLLPPPPLVKRQRDRQVVMTDSPHPTPQVPRPHSPRRLSSPAGPSTGLTLLPCGLQRDKESES